MANILSLAVRVTGDASGLQLTPVEKALQRLQQESDKTSAIFEKFAQSSELGAKAQETFNAASDALLQSLRDGNITRDEFVRQFNELGEAARRQAAALEEGARVTASTLTVEEKRAQELERLDGLLQANAISEETYNRAVAEASGANAEAARLRAEQEKQLNSAIAEGARVTESMLTVEEKRARELERLESLLSQGAISEETFARAKAEASGANAEAARQQAEQDRLAAQALRERQSLESRAASIIAANLTIQERYDRELAELNNLLREGLLTQEQYNRAVAAARKPLDDAAEAADRAAQASGNSALKFSELSGVLAVLPGPLGNIAGRISGIISASEGLTRIFSGGLQSGLSNVVGSFTALATPVNLALAGVTAFGAAAVGVVQGLSSLEGRVERLGRLSDQLGVSFEFAQVLEEAGSRADVSVQQISGAFARLQNTLAGGGEESKKAAEALGNLGISLEEFGALSERQQLELIGERLGGIEDPAKKSAAALDLFGKSGVQLVPFFNELPGAAADIERFGSALSEEDRQRFADLGAAFDAVGVSLVALTQQALLPFVEIVTSAANVVAELIGGLARTANAIGEVLQPLLDQINNVVVAFRQATEFLISWTFASDDAAKKLADIEKTAGAAAGSTTVLAEGLAQLAEEERKLAEDREKLLASTTSKLSEAINASAQFGQAGFDAGLKYQTAIAELAEQLDRGILNEESFQRAAQRAEEAFKSQLDAIKAAAQEAQAITDQVDKLLEVSREIPQLQKDILATESEIARVEAAAARARAENQTEQANALASRLGELDQLQARLQQQADEAAQGFDKGFTAAFESVNQGIQKLTADAAQFGNEGFEAAQRLSEGIAAAQAQVEDGIFNREAFEREVARQEELYRQRIDQLEDERAAREKAENAIASERQKINEFVDKQLAASQGQADNARIQAAKNVQAIEQEIGRVQEEISKARQTGDRDAVEAGEQRIRQLEQVASQEEDIASGRAEREQQIASQRDAALKAQQQQQAAFAEKQEEYYRRAIQRQQQQIQQFQDVLQRNAQENARILASYRELATASTQPAQGADIRTEEGARNFIQALQGGFDPQLAVQRQQLKVQQRIATGLEANIRALGFQTFSFPAAAGA